MRLRAGTRVGQRCVRGVGWGRRSAHLVLLRKAGDLAQARLHRSKLVQLLRNVAGRGESAVEVDAKETRGAVAALTQTTSTRRQLTPHYFFCSPTRTVREFLVLSHDCATRLNDLARGGTSPSPPTRLHGMCATVPRIVALAQSSVWRNLCAPKVHLCSLIAQLWDNPALCAVLELDRKSVV